MDPEKKDSLLYTEESNIEKDHSNYTTTTNILHNIAQEEDEEQAYVTSIEKKLFTYDYSEIKPKLKHVYFFPHDIKTSIKPECFAVRYDKSDAYLAGGFSSGNIILYESATGQPLKNMYLSEYPIASIRWKLSGQKPILVSVHSDGKVSQWYALGGKMLYSFEEKDNFIMCIDYDHYGNTFATGGSDNTVRIYDDDTKTLVSSLSSNLDYISHSNRIFSVCFGKNEYYYNFLTSGGWDNTIKFYDVRARKIVNSIFGPHIVGDSIDIKGHYLLTGSSDIKDQIKIWDLRTYKHLETVSFEPHNENEKNPLFVTNINSAQFSKNFDNFKSKSLPTFACGGLKKNQIRIFSDDAELNGKKYKEKVPLFKLDNLVDCVYSLDYMNNSNNITYAAGFGSIISLDMSLVRSLDS